MSAGTPMDPSGHSSVGQVLIVGGSRGFGYSLGKAVLARGGRAIVVSRTPPPVQLPGMRWLPADVRDPSALEAVAHSLGSSVQHVVYCASDPGAVQPAWAIDEIEMVEVVDVTLHGFIRTVRATINSLRTWAHPSILLVGSQATRRNLAYLSVYSAAKAAAERYALCLGQELQPSGIRVNVIGISAETALAQEHRRRKEDLRGRASEHPLLPEVEDNLALALFLLAPEARWVTGQVIEARQP